MRKTTPETSLKKSAVQLLKIHGIPTWPYPGSVLGVRGFPDRIGILKDGRFLAIEFKSGRRPLTEHQARVRQQIIEAGGKYIICRELQDLIDGLNLPGLFV